VFRVILTPKYVPFVVRILLNERGKMVQGLLVHVLDDQEVYFQNWTELIELIQEGLEEPGSNARPKQELQVAE
jgi:hypothetical protein